MNDWDDFRLILALARSGTLRGTASALQVNHSTVSRRLSTLNKKHGFDLFERTLQGYRPCPATRKLIAAAEEMEAIILSSQRQIRDVEHDLAGDISLSIPDVIGQYLLLDELFDFTRQYPQINLQINSSYQFANLDKSEADVVIRGCNTPPEHLTGHRLFPLYLCLYGSKTLIETVPREQWRWIVAPFQGKSPAWIQQTAYADIPVAVTIDDVTLRHKATLAGKGISRGACYMADPTPELMRLPYATPTPQFDLWVLTHPDLKDVPRIKTLMRFLYQTIQSKKNLITGQIAECGG